ncbi:lasso RiPP family leader peptide-containing protein [Streptomyces sp. 5K101]|uniref:lasso RiPP family leader peptide-containing protein n=1 Tax=Streptomyces sp. 5K101 TaxID=3390037 RepID=UPI00397637AC
MHHEHGHDHRIAFEAETEAGVYVAPAVSDLGSVTEVTLGHAGVDRVDDTQYFI